MNRATPEPMEQLDYGIGYKGILSPQQHMTLKVEGGMLAIALSLVALGAVFALVILLPGMIESRAISAASQASVRSQEAAQNSALARNDVAKLKLDLARQGFKLEY